MPTGLDHPSGDGHGPIQDHCRRCRYALRGIAEDAPCPECGSTHRQHGPHAIFEDELFASVSSAAAGLLCIALGFIGLLPAFFLVPFLGLLAIIFGEITARKRRSLALNRSTAALLARLLGWIQFLPAVGLTVAYALLSSL